MCPPALAPTVPPVLTKLHRWRSVIERIPSELVRRRDHRVKMSVVRIHAHVRRPFLRKKGRCLGKARRLELRPTRDVDDFPRRVDKMDADDPALAQVFAHSANITTLDVRFPSIAPFRAEGI